MRHAVVASSILSLAFAFSGCGGGGGGGHGATIAGVTSATPGATTSGELVAGEGTVGLVATSATVTITRKDVLAATVYEVVDASALRAAGAQDGQELTFDGRVLGGVETATPGALPLELMTFQLVAPPLPPTTTPPPTTTGPIGPILTVPVPAPNPWASRHGLTAAQYQTEIDGLGAKGFRPVAVTAEGEGSAARFTAIWEKDGLPWSARHGMSEADYQAEVTARGAQGFRVLTVDTYDSPVRYAATWVKDGNTWAARHAMTSEQYQAQFDTLTKAGLRPTWVSARSDGFVTRFAAVFVKDGRPFAAVHDRDDASFATAQDDLAAGGLRLVSLARYTVGVLFASATRNAGVWVKDGRPSLAFHGQTAAEYQTTTDLLSKDGYRPITAAAQGGRYTSVWVKDATPSTFRATGKATTELAGLDLVMKDHMQARGISAGALAVTKDGRLVHARGYSWGPSSMTPVEPDARFRLASVSKPLTSLGVLRLVELGKLQLDEPLGAIFPELLIPTFFTGADARFKAITVRQLLQHRGGFDRDLSGDPMFMDRTIAAALGKPLPVTPEMIFAWMSRRKLDFAPGSRYAYSNFGFSVLGLAIERVTGRTYEEFMRVEVLDRVKATGMRVGSGRFTERLAGEPLYVSPSGDVSADVLGSGQVVPNQYGGWNLNTMDSHGGWVSSAPDLCRVLAALDDPAKSPLLSKASIDALWARPAGVTDASFYGLGWGVDLLSSGVRAGHNGSLPGTFTVVERTPDGVTWAVLFNQRSEGSLPDSGAIQGALRGELAKVKVWPAQDLFN